MKIRTRLVLVGILAIFAFVAANPISAQEQPKKKSFLGKMGIQVKKDDQAKAEQAPAAPATPTGLRMLASSTTDLPPAPASAPGKPDMSKMREPGIYAKTGEAFDSIPASFVKAIKTGGFLSMMGNQATMGAKKVKTEAEISGGGQAITRVPANGEFYFSGAGYEPNSFALVKVNAKGKTRKVEVASMGFVSVHNGINDKDVVATQVTKVESGIYLVRPSEPLQPGEYAFVNMTDDANKKIWDFGVDR
jgi:hypothetical protein